MKILVVGDFQGNFPTRLKKKLDKEDFDLIIGVGDYAGISDWMKWVRYDFARAKKGLERISPQEFFGKKGFANLLKKDRAAAKNVLRTLNSYGKKVIFVFGNGDDDWYSHPEYKMKAQKSLVNFYRKLRNMKEINYGKTSVNGIDFIGYGGYMDIEAFFNKKHLAYQTNDMVKRRMKKHAGMKRRFFKLLKEIYRNKNRNREKIFVLHYPPYGVFDIIKGEWKGNPMRGKSSGVKFYTEAIKKYQPRLVVCGHMHEYQGVKKIGNTIVLNPGDAEKGKYAVVEWPSLKVKIVK